jgi:hypothetical protein
MSGCAVPVVILAYNRPEKLHRLLQTLAEVRPATLLLVADGPNATRAGDAERVARTRQLLDRIPWRCEVHRLEAPSNVGCDTWVPTGLDWAFTEVAEAIVVEDDLIVHPGFFSWCAALLERYRHDDRIACVSGRNELVRWDAAGADHALIHRGSNLGFGTWRRAWHAARAIPLPGPDGAIDAQRASGRMDPAVADHCEWLRALCRSGVPLGWDTQWELRRALLGGLSAVSTTNLVVHGGGDEEATHAWADDDLRSIQPLLPPPPTDGRSRSTIDHRLDRWSLFVALATSCRAPRMARRLARTPRLVSDGRTRHHLAPFMPESDFPLALEHLRAVGCRSPRVEAMLEAFGPDAGRGDEPS